MTILLHRTLTLAARGGPATHPNPNTGAVLALPDGTILAEGWHARVGGPHAEASVIAQVQDPDLLRQATLYTSLEPCVHFPGKRTPACSSAIVRAGIRRVVIGCADPNPKAGGGAAWLREQGVEVIWADDPKPFQHIIRPFLVNQKYQRPYLVLKWAETADGYIGHADPAKGQLRISGEWALRYGHSLRSQCQAILIGWRTALQDDPSLTNRLHPSPWQPLPIVVDRRAQLLWEEPIQLLEGGGDVWWLVEDERLDYPPEAKPAPWAAWQTTRTLLEWLYQEGIGSVLVEGGAGTLQSCLNEDLWDEIHILRSHHNFVPTHPGGRGVMAPILNAAIRARLCPHPVQGSDQLFVALRSDL